MPALNPLIVKVAPVPFIAPGFNVQIPEGKPLNAILPVATVQVGWVTVPVTGAGGTAPIITTFGDADEVHPDELVTVKL